ncbi:hypothetical protein [Flavobacterium cheniae]|uniref:DUF4149 domain-containing protein n=1 Tax=Flavobacterium cheniae TaxID=295428 RepID=A0A562KJ64_9FLAO|nr:hypothetical protein [Flavobacterium cheniae]TDR25850.1 hypothetical protein C8D80_0639 [Flavobacterium cheniae]TWH95459.1 hypothetical protein IP97_01135 [Flavobacterium cheniae]
MELISKNIVFAFGLFLIYSGFLMFFNPERARAIIGKAGSTIVINYGELIVRLLLGISFVISAKSNAYELYFRVFGYFLIISAVILMLTPIKTHHKFSTKAAETLRPIYLRICAPFSIAFGILILMAIFK